MALHPSFPPTIQASTTLDLSLCVYACCLRQRVNLRKVGLEVSSTKADELFDSWDSDGGGSLDLEEMREALSRARDDALAFGATLDPADLKRQQLLRQAELCDEAAVAYGQADSLEAALDEERRQTNSRLDIQLGTLLQKRMIKPGEVSTHRTPRLARHTYASYALSHTSRTPPLPFYPLTP